MASQNNFKPSRRRSTPLSFFYKSIIFGTNKMALESILFLGRSVRTVPRMKERSFCLYTSHRLKDGTQWTTIAIHTRATEKKKEITQSKEIVIVEGMPISCAKLTQARAGTRLDTDHLFIRPPHIKTTTLSATVDFCFEKTSYSAPSSSRLTHSSSLTIARRTTRKENE